MTLNTLYDLDMMYFRRHLYETADKIGVESTCFILDALEKDVTRLFKKNRSLFRLCRSYGKYRFEKAAERANFYNKQDPATLVFILKNNLDKLGLDKHTDLYGQQMLDFE